MNENGPKWARAGLIFGVVASIAGNVANACLTETSVSILLRIPMALVWPMALFIGVEVLVRNRAARGILARIGQAGLLTVTVPTAITSFLNLHALMIKAGEPGIAQLTGPLAIDGLMLGCTVMLLAGRVLDTVSPVMDMPVMTPPADGRYFATAEDVAESEAAFRGDIAPVMSEDMDMWARLEADMSGDTVPAAPVSAPPAVRPEGIPTAASEAITSWLDTPEDDRVSSAVLKLSLSSQHGRTTRTVGRWIQSLKAERIS